MDHMDIDDILHTVTAMNGEEPDESMHNILNDLQQRVPFVTSPMPLIIHNDQPTNDVKKNIKPLDPVSSVDSSSSDPDISNDNPHVNIPPLEDTPPAGPGGLAKPNSTDSSRSSHGKLEGPVNSLKSALTKRNTNNKYDTYVSGNNKNTKSNKVNKTVRIQTHPTNIDDNDTNDTNNANSTIICASSNDNDEKISLIQTKSHLTSIFGYFVPTTTLYFILVLVIMAVGLYFLTGEKKKDKDKDKEKEKEKDKIKK